MTTKNKQSDSHTEEQIMYLKANSQEIGKEYFGKKVGMDLNLTYHFGSLAYFALNKVFPNVSKDLYYNDRLLVEVFIDEMASCCFQEGDDFSLQESMKNEAEMVLLTNFVMKTIRNNKKYHPSEIIRKERRLATIHKRACAIIDAYFGDRDIHFSEVEEIFDRYEVIVSEDGRQVDFHFGAHGFTLNKEAASEEILSYVQKERMKYENILNVVKENKTTMNDYKNRLVANQLLSAEQAEQATQFSFNSYQLKTENENNIIEQITKTKLGLEILFSFLVELQKSETVLPSQAKINILNQTIQIHSFFFCFSKGANGFITQLNNYLLIQDFLEGIETVLESKELHSSISMKDNQLKIEARQKRKSKQINFDNGFKQSPKVTLAFILEEGKIFRQTGEEVLTKEVIVYEILERIRNADQDYFVTVEKAKQMLISVLSQEEEQMMESENLTIIEGQKNYYALLNQTYNNVVKIPKNFKSEDELKALCIHPAESHIPMYDGFASIALSVKSGDEDYVLGNSNEFTLKQKVKEKVMNALQSFLSTRNIIA